MKLISTLFFSLVLLLCSGASINAQSIEWKTLYDEANSLFQKGQYEQAMVLAKKSLSVAETDFGPENVYVAASLVTLGGIYGKQGQDEVAEALFKRSIAIYEKASGPDDAHVMSIRKAIEVLHTKNSNKATGAKVSSPTDSATAKIVRCFTSGGVKRVKYDDSAMEKFIHFENNLGLLTVQTQRGIRQYYGINNCVDDSTRRNLISFAKITRELGDTSSDKYLSCEFLSMLKMKSLEEAEQDAEKRNKEAEQRANSSLPNFGNGVKLEGLESRIEQLENAP